MFKKPRGTRDFTSKEMEIRRFIEEKIRSIGNCFRGLWVTREVDINGNVSETQWSVTFIYDGDYTETPYYPTPHSALDHAIKVLEIKKFLYLERRN